MSKHLALIGAGHSHLAVLRAGAEFIAAGQRVTLITPSDYFYYSGMGPGLLSGRYSPQEARFHVKKMAADRGIDVVIDSVVRLNAAQNSLLTSSGKEIEYDVVSLNVGSSVPFESVVEPARNVFPVKPIEKLLDARTYLLQLKERELKVVVAGGGPAGFEISCNLSALFRKEGRKARVTLVAGDQLLPNLPDRGRRIAREALARQSITLREGFFVQRIEQAEAHLDSGERIPFDGAFLATGIRPSPLFRNSGLATGPDGGLPVNEFLQSLDYPNIFGAGDCIHFQPRPLDKVGVYAVREAPILRYNLMSALVGRELRAFHPQKSYLLVFNLGNGKGLFWRKSWIRDGRTAFFLKERLDKRFVKKYQASGEHQERDEPTCQSTR